MTGAAYADVEQAGAGLAGSTATLLAKEHKMVSFRFTSLSFSRSMFESVDK